MCKGGGIYNGIAIFVPSQVNNFQAVLVTNGRHSFAVFNNNQIAWTIGMNSESGGTEEGLGGTPAQVSV